MAVFVLLGRRVEWSPRRVDRLAVWLGFVGEWESLGSVVRCGVGRTACGLAAVFGVGLVSCVFGVGGVLVPVFNLVMGLLLKVAVACSEVAIALGDAVATYLSAGFRLFGFDAGGGCVGGFWGRGLRRLARIVRLVVLGVCFSPRLRRDLQKASRRHLVDGGGGRRFSLRRGRSVCGFSPRRLWWPSSRRRCGVEIGGWRCPPRCSSPCFSRLFSASAASRWQVCAARCRGCSRRLRPACGAACVGDDLCRRICPHSAYLRPYTRGKWRRVDLRRRGPVLSFLKRVNIIPWTLKFLSGLCGSWWRGSPHSLEISF